MSDVTVIFKEFAFLDELIEFILADEVIFASMHLPFSLLTGGHGHGEKEIKIFVFHHFLADGAFADPGRPAHDNQKSLFHGLQNYRTALLFLQQNIAMPSHLSEKRESLHLLSLMAVIPLGEYATI